MMRITEIMAGYSLFVAFALVMRGIDSGFDATFAIWEPLVSGIGLYLFFLGLEWVTDHLPHDDAESR